MSRYVLGSSSKWWTPERRAFLREHAARGWTARQLANALGTTRNAIIGKAIRMGRLLAKQDTRTPEQRRADYLARGRELYRLKREAGMLPYKPRPIKQTLPEPLALKLALVELGADMCHWPVSDDLPHCFCGNDTAGHTYCPFHHMVGRNKNQGRRPERAYVF